MKGEQEMDQNIALELLEREVREVPFCECGAPTVPVARAGGLWLECVSLSQRKSLIKKLLTLDLTTGHVRRRIAAGAAIAGHGVHSRT
jgi:hypothetical protein